MQEQDTNSIYTKYTCIEDDIAGKLLKNINKYISNTHMHTHKEIQESRRMSEDFKSP